VVRGQGVAVSGRGMGVCGSALRGLLEGSVRQFGNAAHLCSLIHTAGLLGC
jgi:hypothetical protein